MKIVHCCFGVEHYIDTWGYQQNLLPMYHAKLGYETVIFASNDTFPSFVGKELRDEILAKGNSYMNGNVRVNRSSSYFHKHIHFQIAKGLRERLEKESPDIIFFHGSLNISLISCVIYKKSHPEVRLYVDNHGDLLNVNNNPIYRLLFFKCYLSLFHKYCQKYVDCYFGVTYGRCNFLKNYLRISPSKVCLLPIGADLDSANEIKESREQLREKNGFCDEDIIIVHGGKLDSRKGTVDLINVYRQLREKHSYLRLVLFGKIVDKRIFSMLGEDIKTYDWLSRKQTLELFKMADLAVWPIHHTTLIEDSIASALPYLIRKTETTQHLINSNFYLSKGNTGELIDKISEFVDSKSHKNYIANVNAMQEKINYYTIANIVVNFEKL